MKSVDSMGITFQRWHILLLCTVTLSVAVTVVGVISKADIVRRLPIQNEVAGPPTGAVNFLHHATDSWGPMKLALAIHRGPHADRLFERLKEFRFTDDPDSFQEEAEFKHGRKYQYPLSSLLPLMGLEFVGLDSTFHLNTINFACFWANIVVIGYLASCCFHGMPSSESAATPKWKRVCTGILAAGVAGTFYPNFNAVTNGNLQMWIDLLFSLAVVTWLQNKKFLSGILIALICGFKPQLAPLLIWAAIWKQWSFCKGFLAVGLPLAAASVVVFGWHNNLAYLDLLRDLSRRGSATFANQSVNGVIHRLIEGPTQRTMVFDPGRYAPYRPTVYAFTLGFSLCMALIAFIPACFRKKEQPGLADYVLVPACFTLASPMIWTYHFGILLPIFVITCQSVVQQPQSTQRTRLLIILAVSWILCASYIPAVRLLYNAPWSLLSIPCFYGALLLMVVVWLTGIKNTQSINECHMNM